jgi:hypothetical protein
MTLQITQSEAGLIATGPGAEIAALFGSPRLYRRHLHAAEAGLAAAEHALAARRIPAPSGATFLDRLARSLINEEHETRRLERSRDRWAAEVARWRGWLVAVEGEG